MTAPENETTGSSSGEGSSRLDIEELRTRYDLLNEKRITVKADKEHADRALQELRTKAKEEYRTDNLDELKDLLEKRKADNEKRRAEYQKHLEEIQAKLDEVDREFEAKEKEGKA